MHLKRGAGAFERAFRRFDNGFDLRSTTRNQLTRARCGVGEKIGNGIDTFPLLRQSCRGRFGAHVHPCGGFVEGRDLVLQNRFERTQACKGRVETDIQGVEFGSYGAAQARCAARGGFISGEKAVGRSGQLF